MGLGLTTVLPAYLAAGVIWQFADLIKHGNQLLDNLHVTAFRAWLGDAATAALLTLIALLSVALNALFWPLWLFARDGTNDR
nr:MAG TPA: hypothetical protein [Caudoviricetes sp.]